MTLQKKQKQTIIWQAILTVLLLFIWIVPVQAVAPVPCPADQLRLNVPFGKACVTNIADYITNFYTYLVGALGILGVAMIMYGGIRWMASNGNSKEIDEARQTIISAIFGVVLALCSYALLNFLNPALVSLKNPVTTGIGTPDTAIHCDSLGSGWKDLVEGDTSKGECGKEFIIKATGTPCVVTTCGSADQLCFHDPSSQNWQCESPDSICNNMANNYCDVIDRQIAQSGNFPGMGCSKRIDDANMGLLSSTNGFDKCVYGNILKPEDDTWEKVKCEGPAIGVCSTSVPGSSEILPMDCNPDHNIPFETSKSPYFCTFKDRPVAGADAICEHKIGTDVYKCFCPGCEKK